MYTLLSLLVSSLLSTFFGPWWLSLLLWLPTILVLIFTATFGWVIMASEFAVSQGHSEYYIDHATRQSLNPDKIVRDWLVQAWRTFRSRRH